MRVAAVPSIEDEREEEGPLACARMEVGRAASPHWPELGHLQGSTCQACQGRSSGNMPVSSDMRSGPVKRGGIVGPCCASREGGSWTTPSTRKVWLGQGSRRTRGKPDGPGRPIRPWATRNSRGFDAQTRFKAGMASGYKETSAPAAGTYAAFRFVSSSTASCWFRVGDQICSNDIDSQVVGLEDLASRCGGIECYCQHPGCRVIA